MKGEMKKVYPVELNIQGRKCIVVGGGRVADRKIKGLLDAGAEVHVVAREIRWGLQKNIDEGKVVFVGSEYFPFILDGAMLVCAATNDRELNMRITEDARKKGVLCNNVTDPEAGDIIIPAIFREDKLVISVSTLGISPALAVRLRDRIAETIVPVWMPYIEFLEQWRGFILEWKGAPFSTQDILRRTADVVYDLMDRYIPPDEGFLELRGFCEKLLLGLPVPEELAGRWKDLWKN